MGESGAVTCAEEPGHTGASCAHLPCKPSSRRVWGGAATCREGRRSLALGANQERQAASAASAARTPASSSGSLPSQKAPSAVNV